MSKEYLWWILGGIALYYILNGGGAISAPVLLGPTVLPDPITSVQAGGQGYTIQSLRTLSLYGPYSTVG